MGSCQVLSLMGRMTSTRVNAIEDFWSPDNSRKFKVRSCQVLSSIKDDLVIKNISMHVYGAGVVSGHSSTKYQ